MENQTSIREYKTPAYIRKCTARYRAKNADKLREKQQVKIETIKQNGEYEIFKSKRSQYMKEYRLKKKEKNQSKNIPKNIPNNNVSCV